MKFRKLVFSSVKPHCSLDHQLKVSVIHVSIAASFFFASRRAFRLACFSLFLSFLLAGFASSFAGSTRR